MESEILVFYFLISSKRVSTEMSKVLMWRSVCTCISVIRCTLDIHFEMFIFGLEKRKENGQYFERSQNGKRVQFENGGIIDN